jgi:hypothetical protein
LDIKTAFLNAMLPGEGADDEVVVILQPPRLLVKLKYVQPDEFWVAVRAIYGLRQSPKLWGAHPATKMGGMSWEGREGSIALEPMVGDPNIWKMVQLKEGWEEVTKGLILVYVDDLLIMGPEPLIQECLKMGNKQAGVAWKRSRSQVFGHGHLAYRRRSFFASRQLLEGAAEKKWRRAWTSLWSPNHTRSSFAPGGG